MAAIKSCLFVVMAMVAMGTSGQEHYGLRTDVPESVHHHVGVVGQENRMEQNHGNYEPSTSREEIKHHYLKLHDTNKDGVLDDIEALKSLNHAELTPDEMGVKMDVHKPDNDGLLTPEEHLNLLARQRGREQTQEMQERMMIKPMKFQQIRQIHPNHERDEL